MAEQSQQDLSHSRQQHHFYVRVHSRHIPHQHWIDGRVQCHFFALHGCADGDISDIDRLLDIEASACGAIASFAMELGQGRTAGELGGDGIRRMGLLLVLLAKLSRRERRQLQLGLRAICWTDADQCSFVRHVCKEKIRRAGGEMSVGLMLFDYN